MQWSMEQRMMTKASDNVQTPFSKGLFRLEPNIRHGSLLCHGPNGRGTTFAHAPVRYYDQGTAS